MAGYREPSLIAITPQSTNQVLNPGHYISALVTMYETDYSKTNITFAVRLTVDGKTEYYALSQSSYKDKLVRSVDSDGDVWYQGIVYYYVVPESRVGKTGITVEISLETSTTNKFDSATFTGISIAEAPVTLQCLKIMPNNNVGIYTEYITGSFRITTTKSKWKFIVNCWTDNTINDKLQPATIEYFEGSRLTDSSDSWGVSDGRYCKEFEFRFYPDADWVTTLDIKLRADTYNTLDDDAYIQLYADPVQVFYHWDKLPVGVSYGIKILAPDFQNIGSPYNVMTYYVSSDQNDNTHNKDYSNLSYRIVAKGEANKNLIKRAEVFLGNKNRETATTSTLNLYPTSVYYDSSKVETTSFNWVSHSVNGEQYYYAYVSCGEVTDLAELKVAKNSNAKFFWVFLKDSAEATPGMASKNEIFRDSSLKENVYLNYNLYNDIKSGKEIVINSPEMESKGTFQKLYYTTNKDTIRIKGAFKPLDPHIYHSTRIVMGNNIDGLYTKYLNNPSETIASSFTSASFDETFKLAEGENQITFMFQTALLYGDQGFRTCVVTYDPSAPDDSGGGTGKGPTINVNIPTSKKATVINDSTYITRGEITTVSPATVSKLMINNTEAKLRTVSSTRKKFEFRIVGLAEGTNEIDIVATDNNGNSSYETIIIDRVVVAMDMQLETPGQVYTQISYPSSSYEFTGLLKTSDPEFPCKMLEVNGRKAVLTIIDENTQRFSCLFPNLKVGMNVLHVSSTFGNSNASIDGPGTTVQLVRVPLHDIVDDDCHVEFGIIKLDTRATLHYDGDIDVGVVITISALEDGVQDITINNLTNPEEVTSMSIITDQIRNITGKPYQYGDDIIISTVKGNKYVKLYRNGEYTNILGALDKGADWFQLIPGDNIFNFEAKQRKEYIDVTFMYRTAYSGV